MPYCNVAEAGHISESQHLTTDGDTGDASETTQKKTKVSELAAYIRSQGDNLHASNPNLGVSMLLYEG